MPRTGVEPVSLTHQNKSIYEISDFEAVHNPVHFSELSKDLQQIVKLWPAVPEGIKQQIFDLIIGSLSSTAQDKG
ncbi:hypothetical protein [Sedimentisphaera salicampi]|uniref:hypothetical protein n=1 Tax=Sedimentisphaera salicampi TaxID=1941349 RepID=UPI000A26E0C7|nr:hypothetical protein [Sedimentisphaera salicampi]